MLPPLGNRTRSRQHQGHQQQYRSPRRSLLQSRTSTRATSRASQSSYAGRRSRATSRHSVDSEVWRINRTPAPPSDISYNMGSVTPTESRDNDLQSMYSQRSPPNRQSESQMPIQQQMQLQPKRPPKSAMNDTTMRPAPFAQRRRMANRERLLDQRKEHYLAKRRARQQQIEIEILEKEVAKQEHALQQANLIEERNQDFFQHKAIKGIGIVRRLRDRHKAEGNVKAAALLSSVLYDSHGGVGGIFGRNRYIHPNGNGQGRKQAAPEKIVLIPNLRSTDGRR
jgi:hypothetical protein